MPPCWTTSSSCPARRSPSTARRRPATSSAFDASSEPIVVAPQRREPQLRRRPSSAIICSWATAAAPAQADRQLAGGNSALLYANGSGQLDNSTAGYAVAVNGMASIHVNGHAGDTAQFFDSPGNDTFYAYADYNNSGQPAAGMYGRRAIANSASGFGTNVGYSTNGGSDTAYFFDSPGNDTFYAYADYNTAASRRRACTAATAATARTPTRPTASPRTSAIRPTAAAIRPISSIRRATTPSMPTRITTAARAVGRHVRQLRQRLQRRSYANSASGFGTNVGYSTNGGSDTAYFFDSPGNATYYAYAYAKNGSVAGRRQACTAAMAAGQSVATPTRPSASARMSEIRRTAVRYGLSSTTRRAAPTPTMPTPITAQRRHAGGGHVSAAIRRQFDRVCQLGHRLRHESRQFDVRQQRYGLFLRLARAPTPTMLMRTATGDRRRACTAATARGRHSHVCQLGPGL